MEERAPHSPESNPAPSFSPYDAAKYAEAEPFDLQLASEYSRKLMGLEGKHVRQQQRIHALEKRLGKDPMTRLYTQEAFLAHGEKLLEEDPDADLAIFHIDLKDFKKLNDLNSHAYGNQALERVADWLVGFCRSDDDTDVITLLEPRQPDEEPSSESTGNAAARTGGDEFAILFNLSPRQEVKDARSRDKNISELYSEDSLPPEAIPLTAQGKAVNIYNRFEKARLSFFKLYPEYTEFGLDFSVGIAIHEPGEKLAQTLHRADLDGQVHKQEQKARSGSYR